MKIWDKITSFEFWLHIIENIKDIGPIAPIFLTFIDKFDWVSLIKQLPILITGIIVYFFGWILTYKVSAKKFEQVNL